MGNVGAAVDIGSNSVHLLVATVDGARGGETRLVYIDDRSDLIGLGDVVDATGEVSADKARAVIESVASYRSVAIAAGAPSLTLVATEPLRAARNARALVDALRAETGERTTVLTEQQEAQLTFIGVTGVVPPRRPTLVVDIGGGSTELGLFRPGEPFEVIAMPVGSARLSAAFIQSDPPTPAELERIRAAADHMRGYLPAAARLPAPDRGLRAIFVGGTATNVGRLGVLERGALAADREVLEHLTADEITAVYGVRPRRAHQLPAGVAMIETLLDHFGLDGAEVSDASLRDGAIIARHRLGDAWPDRLGELISPAG